MLLCDGWFDGIPGNDIIARLRRSHKPQCEVPNVADGEGPAFKASRLSKANLPRGPEPRRCPKALRVCMMR